MLSFAANASRSLCASDFAFCSNGRGRWCIMLAPVNSAPLMYNSFIHRAFYIYCSLKYNIYYFKSKVNRNTGRSKHEQYVLVANNGRSLPLLWVCSTDRFSSSYTLCGSLCGAEHAADIRAYSDRKVHLSVPSDSTPSFGKDRYGFPWVRNGLYNAAVVLYTLRGIRSTVAELHANDM